MEMTWCSAPHFEKIYLEVVVNDGLGILVIQEDKKDFGKSGDSLRIKQLLLQLIWLVRVAAGCPACDASEQMFCS
jgi:hypothetical protein